MTDVEITIKYVEQPCYTCSGTGKVSKKYFRSKKDIENLVDCLRCKGTGIYVEKSYYIIGNGIAFLTDTLK